MTVDFHALAVPGVQQLAPYVPGKPIAELERELGISDIVKLASNENPLGPSPRALVAARDALAEMTLYPDGSGYALKSALAARFSVPMANLTLGNGSNDLLDMVARAFLGPGRRSVFAQYAFAVYPIATQAVGADAVAVPAIDFGHDLEAMAQAAQDAAVVWLANPNNPTGTWFDREAFERFMARLPGHVIVVLDEAYSEYADDPAYPNGLDYVARFPNLVVTRTFSKAYGLAALRVGYAVSSPAIADLLNRVRQPFNVSTPALAAAVAVLGDEDYLARSVATNGAGLVQVANGLRGLGLSFIPSIGNFITLDCARPAAPVFEALLREGVIVRPLAGYGLPAHLRVSIGTAEENARFLAALHKVLA
ncbi:MAG: histidinol-phosphate transaminase [Gammaproteobacteria bacterium]